MGQRLNIEITKNGKVLANSYYHWSAYSESAIDMTVDIVKNFDYIKRNLTPSHNEDLLLAIRILEETGAGMDEDEMKTAKEKLGYEEYIQYKSCKSRNDGIIGITEKAIEDTRFWEEGRVTIDIETKKVDFKVFRLLNEEEMKEYAEETDSVIKEIDINFDNVDFDNVFALKAFIDKSIYNEQYFFKNNYNNEYILLIA